MSDVIKETLEDGRAVSLYPIGLFYRKKLGARSFVTPDGVRVDKPERERTGFRIYNGVKIRD